MRKTILVLTFFIAAAGVNAQQVKKLKIADLVKMIDTSTVPTVINFFATWCGPCVREIPWFEKNVAAQGNKVRMLLVSIDFPEEYPKGIISFMKKNGFHAPVVWLNETNADVFCGPIDKAWDGAIPVTLMVNNRKKYRQFYGQQLPEEKFKLELAKLLE